MLKTSVANQDSAFLDLIESGTIGYVMKGKSEEKTLDIYHLIFAPTYSCNLQCRHCYLPNHQNHLLDRDVALKIVEEWSDIVLDERGQYGGIFHIKGGEPFIVPYLWDIVNKLIELRSLRLMLTTNGTFVEENIFKNLSHCKDALDGHVSVIVSLDGATENTHSILRGKGHFDETLKFLVGLRDNGIDFCLNCVLHKENLNELSEYLNLANRYGATQVSLLSFIPRGYGSSCRTLQVHHNRIYDEVENIYQNGDDHTKTILAGSLPDIKYQRLLNGCIAPSECVAAYRGLFYIIPNGSVFTCPNITFPDLTIGNVNQQNLRAMLGNLAYLYNKIGNHNSVCVCTGEKMFYERSGASSGLNMLNSFQGHIGGNHHKSQCETLSTSYCFNRNW